MLVLVVAGGVLGEKSSRRRSRDAMDQQEGGAGRT